MNGIRKTLQFPARINSSNTQTGRNAETTRKLIAPNKVQGAKSANSSKGWTWVQGNIRIAGPPTIPLLSSCLTAYAQKYTSLKHVSGRSADASSSKIHFGSQETTDGCASAWPQRAQMEKNGDVEEKCPTRTVLWGQERSGERAPDRGPKNSQAGRDTNAFSFGPRQKKKWLSAGFWLVRGRENRPRTRRPSTPVRG
jgi:hypothetical protein